MGNEMGNNNTSAVKEEDNISVAEKKNLHEDTSELANGMSKDIHEDGAKEENQSIRASIAEDDMEKASKASNDITNELRKDIWEEEGHAEDVKGITQTITTDEDIQEQAIGFASNHTARILEKDSMEEYTHASDVNTENQIPPTVEAEGVQEKAAGLVSEDATTELGKVALQEDSHEERVKEYMQMIPRDEAKYVHEEFKGLNSNSRQSMIESYLLGEDTCKSELKMENKLHPTAEVEDVQEKPTGMASDNRSSIENDLLEGDAPEVDVNVDHQKFECKVDKKQIAARLDFDDQTSEFEDKSQENKQDGNVISPTANGKDVQGNIIISASEAPLNLTNSFEGSGDEITEVRHLKKSPNDGSVEAKGGNSESLPNSSLEGTEEYEKREETCLTEHLLVTYNHHHNNEPLILQGDEITEVRQPEKSPNDGSIEDKGGNSDSLSSSSLKGTEGYDKLDETCLRKHLLVTYNDHLNNELSIQQGNEITEVRQPEKSSYDGSEDQDDNLENLSSSLLKSTEECENQEETRLREFLLLTYNNGLNNEPSIQKGDETTEVTQLEKYANDGSVEAEGGNSESLSSSSLEGAEEYKKQKESCLREHQLVTYNHHLNNEPSIHQDEVETTVLALNAVNVSNNVEIEESSNIYTDHDEPGKIFSEQSFLVKESRQEVNLLDTNPHFEQIQDDGLEKEMESHKELFTEKLGSKDGNEFGRSLIDTSGTTSDDNTNGDSLTKVNCTTDDSLTSLIESSIVDNPLMFDHEENCKVLFGESTLSRSGSTRENSHDYHPNKCKKGSLKEYKSGMVFTCDMALGTDGDCIEKTNILLDSNVSRLATSNQVEEPTVTENGVPFDVYINNSNQASEESSAASEEKHFVAPEANNISLIPGLTVVDCRHEEGGSSKNKIEETIEKPESTHDMVNTFEVTEMSEQCNSDLITIIHEESFPLQNNSSLLDIYDDLQDNVDKSFTATNMPNSDLKQTNEAKNISSTIDNLDSSKLKVLSVDLVDDEVFEKEGEEHPQPQHAEAASSAGAELTTSTATMSIDPCSNKSIYANNGYETRDSVTRLSTESNPDNPFSCQMQKSPSFNLNLRKEARAEESDQIPLLHQNKSANDSLSKQTSLNLIKSMPHDEYEQCMLHGEEVPVEEKIVTMERSYSKKPKGPFIGLLKEEEEAHLLDMTRIEDNHVGTKNAVSSISPKRKEKRKARSSFFSSCMCCATVP